MSIKADIKHSFGWNALENVSRLGIQFLIGVILARLLDASDYGILGIVSVFIAISQTVIDSGFSTAILQKKECTEMDYSTAFVINTGIGLLLFVLMMLTAPWIGTFYDSADLVPVLRVMGLVILLQSLFAIQKVRLTKGLAFRSLALITAASSLLSGLIAIVMAYCGYGVWALVVQVMGTVLLSGCLMIAQTRWLPGFHFSAESFSLLFSFGSKVFTSNLLFTVFNNLYNLVIGKCFAPSVLGYYSRADGYAKIVPNNISGVLQNIMLPVLSKSQHDEAFLLQTRRKFVRLCSLFIFPFTLLFCVLAQPVIVLLLTDRWSATVPLLQILCIASLMDHLITINTSLMMVKGKSDYVLSVSVWTKVFMLFVLGISLPIGICAVAWSRFFYALFTFMLSVLYLRRVISVSWLTSVREIVPSLLLSILSAAIAYVVFQMLPFGWGALGISVLLSISTYFWMASVLLKEDVELAKQMLR